MATHPLIGQTLLRDFTVTGLIGEGAMGAVYRAEHSDGGAFAIKKIHKDIASTEGLSTRFEREVSAHAILVHPNIARLYSAGSTPGGEVFFVMELVAGPDLATLLRQQGRLELPLSLSLTKQVLSALHHAHQFGMVHRDLKPENVLLDQSGPTPVAKLIDFGLVKLLENVIGPGEVERLTTAGTVFGTPAYMPPEQIRGTTVDARTDLYALGIMMFEMLTGRLPFDAEEVTDLWKMQLHAPVPSLRGHAPEDIDAIVRTLMAKSPEDRFASTVAVLRALESAEL